MYLKINKYINNVLYKIKYKKKQYISSLINVDDDEADNNRQRKS